MSTATNTTETAARMAKMVMALPPLPATAQKILTCFGDEFIDADKVSEVVESDPGICAKLLGLANSSYFGLAVPLTQIREAISRVLGVDTVRSLVLAMAIQQSFDSKSCPNFDAEKFWIQSLLTAECCKKIVAACDSAEDTDRDLAYSAGLCHNLGLMALAHMQPKRLNDALIRHQSKTESRPIGELLNDEFNTNHREVTAELGRTWSLPEVMVSAYQYRAFENATSEVLLGYVVAAGATAIKNVMADEDQQLSLDPYSTPLGIDSVEIQEMAVMPEKQEERVHSLASNMTR